MPPDEASPDHDNGAAGAPPHSPHWWAALRRVVSKLLDAAEAAARSDAHFRDDLASVFDAWPGGAGAAEVADAAHPAGTSAPPGQTGEPVREVPGTTPVPTAPPPVLPAPTPPLLIPALERAAFPPLVGPREVSTSEGIAVADFGRAWDPAHVFDAAAVAARCRLKAAACRWQAERRRRLDEGAEVTEEDRAMASRGNALNARLWMTSPTKWRDRSDEAFVTVGACYDALADAAETMATADKMRHEQDAALMLLAEAQSAVRAAVEAYASTRRDEDQEAVFAWLRQETNARNVFVQFMQLEYPASPDDHEDLRRRITDLGRRLKNRGDRSREIEKSINKLRYQVAKLVDSLAAGESAVTGHVPLQAIATTVERLLASGVQPSDPRLREALLGVAARIPLDVPPPLARAMDAVDEYLDRLGEEDDGADADDGNGDRPAADPLLDGARRRVAGRRAVMLGGRPNEPARQKLRQGLGLEELDWLRVEHHESFESAARAISRPGVGLVIILTRWRSHRDGPAARSLCRERGIPLVEQPAGYSLRQVAHQICKQFPAFDDSAT